MEAEDTTDETRERAIAAAGMVKAADLLGGRLCTLVLTNVPFLSKTKFDPVLLSYCESHFPDTKSNLAACFVQRLVAFLAQHGTVALVSMQTWLFQVSYSRFRRRLLGSKCRVSVQDFGMKAFRTQMWDFVTCLLVLSQTPPSEDHCIHSI